MNDSQLTHQHSPVRSLQMGMFDMPKPEGWTIERAVNLIAGGVVVCTLTLGRKRSKRWRILTGIVGVNLIMDAAVGWCPTSIVLHRLGLQTAAERALESEEPS